MQLEDICRIIARMKDKAKNKDEDRKDLKEIFSNGRRLMDIAWNMDRGITFGYFLTAFIGALVPVSSSFVFKFLIDQTQIAQGLNSPNIPTIVIFVVAMYFLVAFIDEVVNTSLYDFYFNYLLRYKMQNELATIYHQKIATLDIAHFENPKIQDLMTKTKNTLAWQVPDFIRFMTFAVTAFVGFFAAFIALIQFNIWIGVIVSIVAIPRLVSRAKFGRVKWAIWGSSVPSVRKLWYLDYILQEQTAVKEIRISQASKALIEKFKGIQNFILNENKKPLDSYLKFSFLPPIIESVVLMLIAYNFLPSVMTGAMTIGSFTLLISLLQQLSIKAAWGSTYISLLFESSLYVGYFFEFLGLKNKMVENESQIEFNEITTPKIEFRNVSFGYTKKNLNIKNISFVINPGERVAFVGQNGAGKTTIIKLLCRFYDVTSGEILINDVNIKDIKLSNWYKFIGTLFQEFTKYHFTVRENIVIGDPDRNDEPAMVEAARKSGALEFIEKFPNKFEQILGREYDDGEEISGGQWQKLAIARAFYESPPVLILDEPTSAIDAEAEYEIFTNLEEHYQNKTLILVSHRFSTVRNANKIYVIDNGEVIEQGSHDELMERNGKYANMFSIQAKGYQ